MQFLRINGMSPTEEALRFAAGLWCADYAYLGFRSKDEVDCACRIVDMNAVIDENETANIRKVIGKGLDKACCACRYCMPYCPKQLPIAEYMTYYNLKHVFGVSQDNFEERLASQKQWFMLAKRKADAKDCIGCGECERQCTQHIPIIERIAELAEIEKKLGI